MFDLENKVALVTGGASGIGLAFAKELLRRKLKGVAVVDVNEETGTKVVKEATAEFKRSDSIIFVKADVTDKKQLENAMETTVKRYNQLDILFNNAAVIEEIQWEKCINVNLNAVVYGSMLAIEKYFPKYRSSSESLIINTASMAAIALSEDCPVYVATKAAVVGFTRAMGGTSRYQSSKTKVIAVCPGLVYTNILNISEDQVPEPYRSDLLDAFKTHPGQKPEELAENVINIIPDAPTGSVWLAVAEGCTKIEFPSYGLPIVEQ